MPAMTECKEKKKNVFYIVSKDNVRYTYVYISNNRNGSAFNLGARGEKLIVNLYINLFAFYAFLTSACPYIISQYPH